MSCFWAWGTDPLPTSSYIILVRYMCSICKIFLVKRTFIVLKRIFTLTNIFHLCIMGLWYPLMSFSRPKAFHQFDVTGKRSKKIPDGSHRKLDSGFGHPKKAIRKSTSRMTELLTSNLLDVKRMKNPSDQSLFSPFKYTQPEKFTI